MKIAVNATILDKEPTGLGVYTLNVIREMSKLINKEDKLIVFTPYPEAFKGYNVEIRKVSKWTQPKYREKAGIFRYLWSQSVYPARLIEEKVDLIYNTTHHGTFFTDRCQIITMHDIRPIIFPRFYKLQHRYFKFVLPSLLKRCSAIITNSKSTKMAVSNYYKIPQEKIHVAYLSYNKEIFKSLNPKAITLEYDLDNYLLIVGASYLNKNVDRALEAYSKVKNKINHDLVIVGGRKNYINFLKKKAKALGIDKNTIFLGYVSLNNLSTLYSKADALLFPSLYEGFGIPPLEAMSCGCPVVASNTSSLPEVCGNAAYYVDPYSVDSIAEGIFRILTEENLKATLIKKGLQRAKIFSWENTAKRILRVFEEVFNS